MSSSGAGPLTYCQHPDARPGDRQYLCALISLSCKHALSPGTVSVLAADTMPEDSDTGHTRRMSRPGKIGRNEPCWCGSGKKYKYCHLNSEIGTSLIRVTDKPVHVDILTEQLAAARRRTRNYAARVTASTDALRTELVERIGGGLEGKDAGPVLRDYIAALENAMPPLLANHSRFFWLQLARRWPPDPIDGCSVWSAILYRRIFVLAVLKHSGASADDEFVRYPIRDATRVAPAKITEQDILNLGAVEYLAYELNFAASAFRRVNKGAILEVVDGEPRAMANKDLKWLMKSLDNRTERYGTLSSPYGAAVDIMLDPDAGTPGTPLIAMAWVPNVQRVPGEVLASFADLHFARPPNYIPIPIVLDGIREALVRFEREMTAMMSVSPDALLATIYGLSSLNFAAIRGDARVAAQLCTTGYLSFSYGGHFDGVCQNVGDRVQFWWSTKRGESINHSEATLIAKKAFRALTYSGRDLTSIDLWQRSPFRLLIPQGRGVVFDFSAIVEVLSGLFQRVGFSPNDPDSIKGSAFEAEVIGIAAAHSFAVWRKGGMTFRGAGKRQIDASFVVGDTLFVVECKAFSQNPRIDQGDYAALKGRWEKLHKDYLKQVRTLKDLIQEHRTQPSVAVPSEVTSFEHVVCTTAVEWIPSRDPELWLTKTIPRICTPAELIQAMQTRQARGR